MLSSLPLIVLGSNTGKQYKAAGNNNMHRQINNKVTHAVYYSVYSSSGITAIKSALISWSFEGTLEHIWNS